MFNEYNDSVLEMQEKIFNIWFVLCLAANIVGSAMVIIFSGLNSTAIVCIVCGFIIVGCYFSAKLTKRYGLVSTIILLPIIWVEFPMVYNVFGEVVIAYLLIGIFACAAFLQLKYSVKISLVTFFLYAVVIIINSKNYPLKKVIYNEVTFIITASAVFIVVYTMLLYYERTKKSLNEANDRLEHLASHDSLTSLYNRGYLMNHLNDLFSSTPTGTLAMIDIDDFKKINDTHGHLVGDDALKFLSQTILENIEGLGIAARYGGEEMVLLFNETNLQKACDTLENIKKSVENTFYAQYNFKLTFSGGIVNINQFSDLDKMIEAADNLLYQAKRNGKNQFIS